MFEVITKGEFANFINPLIAKVKIGIMRNENGGNLALIIKSNEGFERLGQEGALPKIILTTRGVSELPVKLKGVPIIYSATSLDHLKDGDIIFCDPTLNQCRTIYRRGSEHNCIFTTEACNSKCLMCSQPPKEEDPTSRLKYILEQIDLFDPDTKVMCITGGEPTLMGSGLLKIISKCKDIFPQMMLHMLTNGRRFEDKRFAEEYAAVNHPNLTAAIPLYSDVDYLHNYVVQAQDAFLQTLSGIHNLGSLNQRIEIRTVIHQQTYQRLPSLAEFIFRNLPFVNHIALMGLEITGFTKFNLKSLWIDPCNYQDQLEEAVFYLANHGMNVSIYNHQLCVLRKSLWPFAKASISDWKNVYDEECNDCDVRTICGGFFKWSPNIRSAYIRRVKY